MERDGLPAKCSGVQFFVYVTACRLNRKIPREPPELLHGLPAAGDL